MSFDHTAATPEQLAARLAKFKRKVERIKDPKHYAKIVASFPPKMRKQIKADVPFEGRS